MKHLKFAWRILNVLIVFIMAAGFVSCVNEIPVEPDSVKTPGEGNAIVKLEVHVPGNNTPSARALTPLQEDEVSDIIVFAFEKGGSGGDEWDTKLKHVGKSTGEPAGSGTIKQFTVELLSGEWDLWVVANAGGLMEALEVNYGVTDIYSNEFKELNLKKSDLQAAVIMSSARRWNIDPNDEQQTYRIPMWGMLNAVQVQTSSTNIIKTVNLYRMVAKVDVVVQREPDETEPEKYPGIPTGKFELAYVSLHNYNTTARLVPGVTPADGNWLAENGGAALRTSLPANPNGVYGWEPEKRLEYSDPTDFTTDHTAMEGVIYTFEAGSGTHNGNRPCVIIGGRYNQSDEITYYRADFVNNNKEYLNLLRNHKYRFLIRKIGGKGFPSVEEAYKAGPTNIEADVIEWNDGGFVEGIWNGNYEIRFSSVKAHFSQFGTPSPQVINVRSNVPTLSLDDFTNTEIADGDSEWERTGEQEWTNGHFRVTFEKSATMDEYSDYKITITADPSRENDPTRVSTFKVKGYMLEVLITITQDYYIKYLLTSLDESTLKAIDGVKQRVKVRVSSTHPYKIDFKGNTMFLGGYDVAVDGTAIDETDIPESKTDLWVEIDQHTGDAPRVGEFFIRHVDLNSTAQALIYQVLQVTPAINAVLSQGGYTGQLPQAGGELTINVSSNLSGWIPVLVINGVSYTGNLSAYFDIVQGAQSQSIKFRAGKLTEAAGGNVVYTIYFRDINSSVETQNAITVNQTWKSKGFPAEPGILAVDEDGVLNLDGRGYMVYFKWGSAVAFWGRKKGYVFEGTDDIAWAPSAFDMGQVTGTGYTAWNKITYPLGISISYPDGSNATDLQKGYGDPCLAAVKNGKTGEYRIPTANPYEQFMDGELVSDYKGLPGRWSDYETTKSQFYPFAGRIYDGETLVSTTSGHYWSYTAASSTDESYTLKVATSSSISTTLWRGYALPIRCVRK